MNILFFQNCVSPHQMPYISLLSTFQEVDDVVVVVPEIDMASRKAMGWDASTLMNTVGVNFIVAPSEEAIQELYEKYADTDAWCVFSGINSFVSVMCWFRFSLKYKVKRCLMTEPPLIYNHPLWQHALRFVLKDWRYVKYIDKVFVMGDEFVSYYRFWSRRWNIFPFMYCTEWRERSLLAPHQEELLKVLFVGSLSHRKNVQVLLNAARLLDVKQQKQLEIGIVGDGELRTDLENLVNRGGMSSYVTFYGMQPMEKIPNIMEQYDILCLPSLHDGWGAVVNEALTLGLYVICSNHCGAKYLIRSSNYLCGRIFESNNAIDLSIIIGDCIISKNEIRGGISERIMWAKTNISGEAVAYYFLYKLKL